MIASPRFTGVTYTFHPFCPFKQHFGSWVEPRVGFLLMESLLLPLCLCIFLPLPLLVLNLSLSLPNTYLKSAKKPQINHNIGTAILATKFGLLLTPRTKVRGSPRQSGTPVNAILEGI